MGNGTGGMYMPSLSWRSTVVQVCHQCTLPVIDNLLPESLQRTVNHLVFVANHWFSLAKLHLHSDSSLQLLQEKTASFGKVIRRYARDTAGIDMVELPKEVAARQRRLAKATEASARGGDSVQSSSARPKPFNLNTFKNHNIDKYVDTIKRLGTTDSYTTGIVSL